LEKKTNVRLLAKAVGTRLHISCISVAWLLFPHVYGQHLCTVAAASAFATQGQNPSLQAMIEGHIQHRTSSAEGKKATVEYNQKRTSVGSTSALLRPPPTKLQLQHTDMK
jgi:hypothetical protein